MHSYKGHTETEGVDRELRSWSVDITFLFFPHQVSAFTQPMHNLPSVVQSLSHVWLFVTPWTAACQDPLSFIIPRVCSNSCPLSQWFYLTISSSVAHFSSCPKSFPASGSFLMSWLFTSGDESIGASASASVLPNEYSGLISFRIDWFDVLVVSPRDSQGSSPAPQFECIIILGMKISTCQFGRVGDANIQTMVLTKATEQNSWYPFHESHWEAWEHVL